MKAWKAIMNNEGCSKEEAMEICEEIREEIHNCIIGETNCTPDEILLSYELEPDYIFDFI